eukprot:scaffold2409_cov121-Isochrysis_galbana.AAC.5
MPSWGGDGKPRSSPRCNIKQKKKFATVGGTTDHWYHDAGWRRAATNQQVAESRGRPAPRPWLAAGARPSPHTAATRAQQMYDRARERASAVM